MERNRVAIIIPAFNEAATIALVASRVRKFGIPIVVDDGSCDGTGKIAEDAGATVIRIDVNSGYDAAIAVGFEYASMFNCEFAVTLDADGQHDPHLAKKFVQELKDGADVVVGRRNKLQRIGEYFFAWVGNILWGIRDPLCGAKGYRLETTYRELGHYSSYKSIGTELLIYSVRSRKKITEIEIETRLRIGKSRFGSGIKSNMMILYAICRGIF